MTRALALTLLFLVFTARPVCAERLADLEAVTAQATSLRDFLGKPDLVEKYYAAAAAYYGAEVFSRPHFDELIAQIKKVDAAVPGFGERAWGKAGGAALTVTSDKPTFNRLVDGEAWPAYLAAWKARLRTDAGELAGKAPADVAKQYRDVLATMAAEVAAKTSELEAVQPRRARDAATAEFHRTLGADPRLTHFASYAIANYLDRPEARRIVEGSDADLILNLVKDLREDPALAFRHVPGLEVPSFVTSVTKRAVPENAELTGADIKLFPRRTVQNNAGKQVDGEGGKPFGVDFVPIGRRFHGFFKGMATGECVGGGPKSRASELAPARWATSSIDGAEMHFVEREGKFQGFVQIVPVRDGAGKTWGSVELASPLMRKWVIQNGPDGMRSRPLVAAWLAKTGRRDLVVGDDNAVNNGGALSTVRLTPEYLLSTGKVAPAGVKVVDPMAAKIAGALPMGDVLANYARPGAMLFDATAVKQSVLTVLAPSSQSTAEVVRAALARGDNAFVAGLLQGVYAASFDNETKLNLGILVSQLRSAGILDLVVQHGFRIAPGEGERTMADYEPELKAAGFSPREVKLAVDFADPSSVTAPPPPAPQAAPAPAPAPQPPPAEDFASVFRAKLASTRDADAFFTVVFEALHARDGAKRRVAAMILEDILPQHPDKRERLRGMLPAAMEHQPFDWGAFESMLRLRAKTAASRAQYAEDLELSWGTMGFRHWVRAQAPMTDVHRRVTETTAACRHNLPAL